nr:MAG TPA: hypothetical protein [Caudoviricetes sp.]
MYQVRTDAKKKITTKVRGYLLIPSAYVHQNLNGFEFTMMYKRTTAIIHVTILHPSFI